MTDALTLDLGQVAELTPRYRSPGDLAEQITQEIWETATPAPGRPQILPEKPGQQEFVEKLLTGSQAKTAYALRLNAERMIREAGLNSIGFLTLTVGDQVGPRFEQVKDSTEASRRINNLNRRLLSTLFDRAIIVTERHKSGAIHFHVLGALAGSPDIRTGLDFDAIAKRDYRSASPALRSIWAMLRDSLPAYGFGRAELLPVKKTGEAVACYVSKYIEKNVCNRLKADHRKKLVRYIGWNKGQLKPNEFSWGTPRATAWRLKARTLAGLVGIYEREEASFSIGPRWAFTLTNLWQRTLGDDLKPGFDWTFQEKQLLKRELVKVIGERDAERLDAATKYQFAEEYRDIKHYFLWRSQLRQPPKLHEKPFAQN